MFSPGGPSLAMAGQPHPAAAYFAGGAPLHKKNASTGYTRMANNRIYANPEKMSEFVASVRRRPQLWDRNNERFSTDKKLEIWAEVEAECGFDFSLSQLGELSRTLWRRMIADFRRHVAAEDDPVVYEKLNRKFPFQYKHLLDFFRPQLALLPELPAVYRNQVMGIAKKKAAKRRMEEEEEEEEGSADGFAYVEPETSGSSTPHDVSAVSSGQSLFAQLGEVKEERREELIELSSPSPSPPPSASSTHSQMKPPATFHHQQFAPHLPNVTNPAHIPSNLAEYHMQKQQHHLRAPPMQEEDDFIVYIRSLLAEHTAIDRMRIKCEVIGYIESTIMPKYAKRPQ